ncbi:MAG: DUF2807 domain-containing protein [Nitrospiraceae bacterium]
MAPSRPFRLIAVMITLCLGLFEAAQPAIVQADEENQESDGSRSLVTVPRGQTIARDYFAAADQVEIYGTINGDAHVIARRIIIDGTVNGDLLAAGAIVTISGKVTADARVVGGRISISGQIGRNLTVGGGMIETAGTGRVEGAMVAGGGSVHLAGPIAKSLTVGGGEVTLSNEIGGHVNAAAGSLRVTSNAKIDGNLSYMGQGSPTIDDPAAVKGRVTERSFRTLRIPQPEQILAGLAMGKLLFAGISFVSTLVLGLLLLHFYPIATELTVANLSRRTLASFGTGLLLCLLGPLVILLLTASVMGLPLALVAAAGLFLIFYLSRVFTITWLGWGLLRGLGRAPSARGAFVTGLIVYFLMTLIPFVGGFVAALMTVIGTGAVLLTKGQIYQKARYHELI